MGYELDIPLLTEDGIRTCKNTFYNMKELSVSSMIDLLIMIEMLIHLIHSTE